MLMGARTIVIVVLIAGMGLRAMADSLLIDDFTQFALSREGSSLVTDEWSNVYDKGKTIAGTVLDNGRRVLSISGENNSFDIARKPPFDHISQYPYLRWEWEAILIPQGADIVDPNRDDSASQIYVNFDLKSSYLFYPSVFSICYYYGSTEKKGRRDLWEGFGTFVSFICVRSAPEDGVGKWFTEERNVLEDYREAVHGFLNDADRNLRAKFRSAYTRALGIREPELNENAEELLFHSISIWVDSNDTGTGAESRYGPMTFLSGPTD
jgi:hypothetical protein